MNKKQKKALFRIMLAAALLLANKLMPLQGAISLILYLIAYLAVGYSVLKESVHGILNKQLFDENFLMAVATVGAVALQNYSEAVAVMLFYQIGELFESIAVGKSRKNISALMDIKPEYANLRINGEIEKVDPEEVEVGSEIIVKVGEKIPIDGIVIQGQSSLNTAALTGEAKPSDVKENDDVVSGCINLSTPLTIKTTKRYVDSTVAKVLDLIENATSNKSKSEDFISKFARHYTPTVCVCALALAVLPPVVNLIMGNAINFPLWLYRALTFLVISCPCALVISIPLTFFAGIGCASKAGVLVKGSNYLETLAQCSIVVFDKTGTMTKGVFEVDDVHHNTIGREELLCYAAHAEIYSVHPIAESIKRAYGEKLDSQRVESIHEFVGKGIEATIDNKTVLVGNDKLMQDHQVEIVACRSTGTAIHVAIDGEYAGHILINDTIKPTAKETITQLKKMGITRTVMLSGDLQRIAEHVKNELQIDEAKAELLPDQKVRELEKIIANKKESQKVAFVGDGINDAPVIARSDVGIAMGAFGSDAAIEAADVVLMDDNPLKLTTAIKVAKKSMRIVYENIIFAIGIKILFLILGAFGISDMAMAIFADVGVMIIAVVNAIRALFIKGINNEKNQ